MDVAVGVELVQVLLKQDLIALFVLSWSDDEKIELAGVVFYAYSSHDVIQLILYPDSLHIDCVTFNIKLICETYLVASIFLYVHVA